MNYILISNTNQYKINKELLNSISFQIKEILKKEVIFNELSIKKAYECHLPENEIPSELLNWVKVLRTQNTVDINIIKSKSLRKKKLLLADMDSTIIKNESLDELAKFIGKGNEISKITKKAMEGKIQFEEALLKRVEMLEGVPFKILENLKKNIIINDGAKELIQTMKQNGSVTVLVSGGFTFLTNYLKEILDFDHVHGNSLKYFVNDKHEKILTGKVKKPILDKEAKLKYLMKYLKKYNLKPEDSMCVGDGANDVDMIINSGLGVSYKGKKALNLVADLYFKHTNLLGLLYAQGYKDIELLKK